MFVHSCIFGISYIDYFAMCDFMILLVDQIPNVLPDDVFYVGKCIICIMWPVWTGHNARQLHLLIKVTLKLKESIFVLDKHKAIILYYPMILESIYGHFVMN